MADELAKLKPDERKWKIEDAARTLKDAAKIRRDPNLHKAAIAELKKQKQDISRVLSASK